MPDEPNPRKNEFGQSYADDPHLYKREHVDKREAQGLTSDVTIRPFEYEGPREDKRGPHSDQIGDNNRNIERHYRRQEPAGHNIEEGCDTSRKQKAEEFQVHRPPLKTRSPDLFARVPLLAEAHFIISQSPIESEGHRV